MNAEAFTLKARRTTRVPLRVPIQVGVEEGGQWKASDGWTVIVNIHGAKIECKRRMALDETVKVTVPLTRKSQTGKVVWSGDIPNAAGNYEFAVELTEPGNLWGVGFPPSDWKEVRQGMGPIAVESKPGAAVEAVLPAALSVPSEPAEPILAQPKKIAIVGYQPTPIVPFAVSKPGTAMESPAQEPVDLSELAVQPPVQAQPTPPAAEPPPPAIEPQRPSESLLPELTLEPEPLAPPAELNCIGDFGIREGIDSALLPISPEPAADISSPHVLADESPMEPQLAPVPQDTAGEPAPPLESQFDVVETSIELNWTVVSQEASLPLMEPPAVPPLSSIIPVSPSSEAPLSAAVYGPVMAFPPAAARAIEVSATASSAVAEAAWQSRLDAMIERSSAKLEARLAEMESLALERVDKKLRGSAEDHYERLDQHSESLVAARSLDFEQALTKFSAATDEAARSRQHELVSRMEQDLRRRAGELATYTDGQLRRCATEAAENAQSAMAAGLQDLLASIEQDIGESCRRHAEQTHLIHRAQFEGLLSSRIEDARSYWQGQLEEMQQQAVSSVNATLEGYMEAQSRKLTQQMDQALAQMAGQIQKTFFRHVVEELSNQQQAWMSRLRREMDQAAEQSVHRVRRQFMDLLGAMGQALVSSTQHAEAEPELPLASVVISDPAQTEEHPEPLEIAG